MTAKMIDGKACAASVRARVAEDVARLSGMGIGSGLAVVLVGEDPASGVYVRSKERACREAGHGQRSSIGCRTTPRPATCWSSSTG